jgi:putative chitinase
MVQASRLNRAHRHHEREHHAPLRIGSRGKEVAKVEKNLHTLGYLDPAEVDGKYDRETADAVKHFRRDQPDLRNRSSGAVSTAAQEALKREVQALRHDPEHTRVHRNSQHQELDRRTAAALAAGAGIGEGDKRARLVANVQRHLKAAGYDPQNTKGHFDERTAAALKAFQRHSDLAETGQVDSATWAKLSKSIVMAKNGTSPPQTLGERSRAVLKTERLLDDARFDPGRVDGKFDQKTLKALKRFERKHPRAGDADSVGDRQLDEIRRVAKKVAQEVTPGQLRRIMPGASDANIHKFLPHLNRAMAEMKINTPKRQAAFLAQVAVESGQLVYNEEIADGSAYEGRLDLGNTHPGDGRRFKGRGLIQLTGRANYRSVGRALGIDLVHHPRVAKRPRISARIAAYFFKSRGLNEIADRGDIREVSYRVNGGTNGLAERIAFWHKALRVLG